MPRRIALVAIAVLAVLGTAGAPARATSQSVTLGHDEFIPSRVAVKPGETVEWTNPDQAEEHNVHFDDGSFVEPDPPAPGVWVQDRTFPNAGAFAYHCDIHGAPGGVGMSGVVYVNATGTVPPLAGISATPGIAAIGQTVTFSATSTKAGVGRQIVKYEWDLDGNGSFETDTGSTPSTSRTYASSGDVDVKVRVTDDLGLTDVKSYPLHVTAVPTASFSASPSSPKTGQAVTFDGSTSTDADGTIARYEWDLDGNGSFETDTAANPRVTRTYLTAGARSVRLRVTDDDGASSETTRTLQVTAASTAPPQPAQPAPSIPAPVVCSALSGTKRATCMQRACASVSRSRRTSCYQKSCRYLPRTKRASCVVKSCRWTSSKKRRACKAKSCRWLRGSKKRACVRKYARRR